MKKIVFCTLRNNKGPIGGPGGVLFMQKNVIGDNINGIPCEYQFNICDWNIKPFHLAVILNQILFFFKYLFCKNTYFITNDVDQADVLALMGKQYSLIFHHQGPIVQELLNLGRKMGKSQINQRKSIERYAFINSRTLHFPSSGALEMYFDNQYASCNKKEVQIGAPLYNIIVPQPIKMPKETDLLKESNVVTLFSAGTLTPAKGQDHTIKFIEEALRFFNKPVRYIIVGKGPMKDELLTNLNGLKEKHNSFKYYYYETLPHDDVMYIHSISDVYIMLHRISIFDIATLEAISNNCMVILSKVGGNIDFNKNNNIVFAEDFLRHPFALTSEIIESYKKKNLDVFEKYFSQEAYRKQYSDLLKIVTI